MDRLLMDTLELSRIGRVINSQEDAPFNQIAQEALEQMRQVMIYPGEDDYWVAECLKLQ